MQCVHGGCLLWIIERRVKILLRDGCRKRRLDRAQHLIAAPGLDALCVESQPDDGLVIARRSSWQGEDR